MRELRLNGSRWRSREDFYGDLLPFLFYLTEVERDAARDQFREWASPREDGL
jgi:hypothetical protein